ncbi:hypothetical protein BSK65_12815 [Paenibacillus odorifer]|uniref:Aminoglycoside nucleotidyltransferase n=1 Tax=Paenibacillus odorifer TaxID=189426 RepID=A0A1R0ZGV2_9BACL|nr:hypothetical protein [Paenibacillus odorifer]OMD46760.1 hypothetical protein BSK51_26290 [Paenibacillus odorifer]OME69814.1 hypothetical protein BSK65_12815 [Paenibacillus odorifer]
MNSWEIALSKVCELYFSSEVNSKLEWILVGSVGSVLQGCEMTPGDVDIYTKNKEGIAQFAELLKEYSLLDKCEFPHGENWLSSLEEPTYTQTFSSGFSWTKGSWIIDGFKVEVVHISNSVGIPDSMDGDGIWEGGQFIWNHFRNVTIGRYTIPTVPLEIQLESNLRRQRSDRTQAIITALQKYGYDHELIEKALSKKHLPYFHSQMN